MSSETSATMRAAVYHGPGKPLVLEQVPRPVPGPGEVLVQVAACGVCHTDLHYLDHGVKTFMPPPLILGHEATGVVVALGTAMTPHGAATPGARVLLPPVLACGACEPCRRGRENICESMRMFGNNINGAYAEYVVAPARDLIPFPATLPLEEGAILADAVSTPFHAVKNRGRVQAGDWVVVLGCGGLGMSVVQCALALGARVIAVDVNDTKLATAAALGATVTLDGRAHARIDKEVRRRTGGGADVAFEAIGRPETIRVACDALRRGGRLCVVGYCAEDVPLPMSRLMYHELEVIGSLGCPGVEYPRMLDLVERGRIRLDVMVTGRFALEDINDAFDRLRRGEGLRSIVVPALPPGAPARPALAETAGAS
jgi:6-hydroxycyclohex-1-ene-1-carbonyl-CoA dehydrogenase